MVKRPLIAKKPTTNNLSPTVDDWVNRGGIDPEIQTATSEEVMQPPSPQVAAEPESQEKQEKPFPHRISFDMGKEQYKRLKFASFESERSMNEILREAVENWLKEGKH